MDAAKEKAPELPALGGCYTFEIRNTKGEDGLIPEGYYAFSPDISALEYDEKRQQWNLCLWKVAQVVEAVVKRHFAAKMGIELESE